MNKIKKNGCYDREFKMTTLVQDGYEQITTSTLSLGGPPPKYHHVPRFVVQPFRMSTDCKYDLKLKDVGCNGCKHQ